LCQVIFNAIALPPCRAKLLITPLFGIKKPRTVSLREYSALKRKAIIATATDTKINTVSFIDIG